MYLLKELLNGRLFGHPIHMMLVHFPAALFPLSAAGYLVAYILNDMIISLFNFYLICLGSLIGWLALIFGFIDLINIQTKKEPFKVALIHGGLNSLWLSVFTVFAGIQLKYYPFIQVPSLIEVIIINLLAIFMIYSNYLGGELILKYKIGSK